MNKLTIRQIHIVEFAAKVYHSGLRHTGINGALYENKLIQYLREDIPELDFFRGQITKDQTSSSQYDILICKKGCEQKEFLRSVDPFVNIVDHADCLGVIELKKWGNPKMIAKNGSIDMAYKKFKKEFPKLSYLFVTLRFKDSKKIANRNWKELSKDLEIDGKFCFFGNVYHSDREWEFPWTGNVKLIEKNFEYHMQYELLINEIKNITQ
ncbi:MAG: hypothetical protein LAT76_10965 [Schleiferiaceae bacterium]|nr:hypothetical protein [Schleiferiaceae bacterium]